MLAPSARPLGGGRADHQGTREPRSRRGRKGIHVAERNAGHVERVRQQQRQLDEMLARSGLRDDAAVRAVEVDLRGNLAGEEFIPTAQEGHRRLVTRRFDGEDQRAVRRRHKALRKARGEGATPP